MTQSSKIQAKVLKGLVWFGAIMTIGILAFLVLYILIMGVPNLSLDLFAFKYTTENVSLFPALVNTIIMIAVTLVISVPLGIGSAIFLEEYAKRGNILVKFVAITTETLSGIPSIVYGIFGMLFFVTTLGWGYSMLAGSCTLAIMILPLIMRTTQDALKSV
ncbi:MAG: ABC transporter permease subunit, partial [Eubacterium sp.]